MLAGTGFRSVCCGCEERAQVVCMYTTLQRRECGFKCAAQQIHHCALLCCAVLLCCAATDTLYVLCCTVTGKQKSNTKQNRRASQPKLTNYISPNY